MTIEAVTDLGMYGLHPFWKGRRLLLRPHGSGGRVQRGLIRILNVYLVDWKVLPSGGTYSTRAQAAQAVWKDGRETPTVSLPAPRCCRHGVRHGEACAMCSNWGVNVPC